VVRFGADLKGFGEELKGPSYAAAPPLWRCFFA
jgi:hypothetical protein